MMQCSFCGKATPGNYYAGSTYYAQFYICKHCGFSEAYFNATVEYTIEIKKK